MSLSGLCLLCFLLFFFRSSVLLALFSSFSALVLPQPFSFPFLHQPPFFELLFPILFDSCFLCPILCPVLCPFLLFNLFLLLGLLLLDPIVSLGHPLCCCSRLLHLVSIPREREEIDCNKWKWKLERLNCTE